MNQSFSDSGLSAGGGLSAQRSQHIVLKLDTHNVALNIPADREPIYREAAELLNERYHVYQRRNPSASIEKIWLYVALEAAVNLKSDEREKGLATINKKIQAINQLIETSKYRNTEISKHRNIETS